MARVPFTSRMGEEKLRRGPKARSLEVSLERLRAYGAADPSFRGARRAFVEAEAGLTDSVEGTAIDDRQEEGGPVQAGPVQCKLRAI